MISVMGLIYTGESDSNLRDLTLYRSISALPFAGRYRVIDFLLSNMTNSGIRNVGVIMQKNYHSLMDHLGSGKEWDLHGKHDGLKILPPFLTRENVGVYTGSVDALRSNLSFLSHGKQDYVVLTDSRTVFNTDFNDMIRAHIDSGAVVTAMYSKDEALRRPEEGFYFEVGEKQRVTGITYAPTHPGENTAMQVFVLRREMLWELVEEAASKGCHSFFRDVLQPKVADGTLRMYGYEFTGKAYLIDSVPSYFAANMALLNKENRQELFCRETPVLTKVRDEMPAKYLTGAKVANSLVADGCVLEGTVENSILFRHVSVAKGAVVKNCIIFQDGQICEGTHLENCIIDKDTVIQKGTTLIGPATHPIVLSKGTKI